MDPAQPTEHAAAQGGNLLAPDIMMAALTWVTFFILFFILRKFAWKPILDTLQKREDYIRQSLGDADRAKAELAGVETTKAKILDETRTEAAKIIQDSRSTAAAVAADIEANAKKHAHDILESAKAQIQGERERVTADLKRQAVNTAIKLAEKVLEENLDEDKNRRLVEKAVEQDMIS